VFDRVCNHKNDLVLWYDICVLHEGTKSDCEEFFHLVMKKLNSFQMLLHKNAVDMYS
jgi:hypothetical protein